MTGRPTTLAMVLDDHDRNLLKAVNNPRAPHKGYATGYCPEHPSACQYNGRVYIHRLVMECLLGRYLDRGEHVHHRDENRSNFDPGNLKLMTQAEHLTYHNKQRRKQRVTVLCGCGCGAELVTPSPSGRDRRCLQGHRPKVRIEPA